jgi:superfamily II DNA or RNA helicase
MPPSLLLHATWNSSLLHLWVERTKAERTALPPKREGSIWRHPYVLRDADLEAACSFFHSGPLRVFHVDLDLPADESGPLLSIDSPSPDVTMDTWRVPALLLDPIHAVSALSVLPPDFPLAPDAQAWRATSLWTLGLLSRARVVPTMRARSGVAEAAWEPSFNDPVDAACIQALAAAMPPSAVAPIRSRQSDAIQAFVRLALSQMTHTEELEMRRPVHWPNASLLWLETLCDGGGSFSATARELRRLEQEVGAWTRRMGSGPEPRLCVRLLEPSGGQKWRLDTLLAVDETPILRCDEVRDPAAVARSPWAAFSQDLHIRTRRLVREAAEILPVLAEVMPVTLDEDSVAAFLLEQMSALEQAGILVLTPPDLPNRLTALDVRLLVERGDDKALSRESLLDFKFEAIADGYPIDVEALRATLEPNRRLVKVGERWMLLDQGESRGLADLLKRPRRGNLGEALKMACTHDKVTIQVADVLTSVPTIRQPRGFQGKLRPYQVRGVAWLLALRRMGLGALLADDMGLGKTVQVIALLQHDGRGAGPVLLVCPTSVVGNWRWELYRFAPELKIHVHHGSERQRDEQFEDVVEEYDLVITTYGLAARDLDILSRREWRGVIIDEAQNIKNPRSAQSSAVRRLPARDFRIALTGTPVENRLTDLWSIMDFLNPGLLGSAESFQRRFALPIGRGEAEPLKRLRLALTPLLLRRSKTDASVIADLPDKVEMKTYCPMTREQATLYKTVADEMLAKVDDAKGMMRRNRIIAAIVRLKQICNHPASIPGGSGRLEGRSGKLARLEEMLEEVIANGERALVFTQFAQWGELLHAWLAQRLEVPVAWLHGGTPRKQRDEMVAKFNSYQGPMVFILSLRAGGTGLNLVGANHVFHYDRWWNPAVENQATDRAFRIGQRRNVQVHKLISLGTLEESIDRLIERKIDLAAGVLDDSDAWLTELSNTELRDLVLLREDDVEAEV